VGRVWAIASFNNLEPISIPSSEEVYSCSIDLVSKASSFWEVPSPWSISSNLISRIQAWWSLRTANFRFRKLSLSFAHTAA
jgi:hypothetical protein